MLLSKLIIQYEYYTADVTKLQTTAKGLDWKPGVRRRHNKTRFFKI